MDIHPLLETIHTETGKPLSELTDQSPVLLVFLRHFGCTFARQAIADVAEASPTLAQRNIRPVFVHLGTPELAKNYFDYYGLSAVERISDPSAHLYSDPNFKLTTNGSMAQLFGWKTWKAWMAGGIKKHGIAIPKQNPYVMSGVFLLKNGEIATAFRPHDISDRPDYLQLCA